MGIVGTLKKRRLIVACVLMAASVATATTWTTMLLVVFLCGGAEQTVARKKLARWSSPWAAAMTYEVAWCVACLVAAWVRSSPHGLVWSLVILGAAVGVDLTHRGIAVAMRGHLEYNRELVARPIAWLAGVFVIWIVFVIQGTVGSFLAWVPTLAITALVPLTVLRMPMATTRTRKLLAIEGFGTPDNPKYGLTDIMDRYVAAFLVGGCVLLVFRLGGAAL